MLLMIVYVKEPIVLYRGQTWSLTTLRFLHRDCTCLEGGRGGTSFPSPTARRTTEQPGARQHLLVGSFALFGVTIAPEHNVRKQS